jgi:hypothetical protein
MKKLTMFIDNKVFYSQNGNPILPVEMLDTPLVREVLKKLSEYEDIELTPDVIKYKLNENKLAAHENIENCKYCDEDRLIEQGAIWFGEKGTKTIGCINSLNEFVVNIKGNQANIPIRFCPWCGSKL